MADIDVIREIPGYKVILKIVLKNQIQQLVEQLASHTDEESVILTANTADGSLSHLGSESGKSFLNDHEDMKSQFLGFCLKRRHLIKENKRRDSNTLDGYSQEMLHWSRYGYDRTRTISENRNRGLPYHREKGQGHCLKGQGHSQKSLSTCPVGSSVKEAGSVNMAKEKTESVCKNEIDNESSEPLDLNTGGNETHKEPHFTGRNDECCKETNETNSANVDNGMTIDLSSNSENSKTNDQEPIVNLLRSSGVKIKTEPENDSDVEVLANRGQSEVSDLDNSWELTSSASVTFDPAAMVTTSAGQSEFMSSSWKSNSSSLSTMTFDPLGLAGSASSTSSVAYSFKKRFIGRQTSELARSNLSPDKQRSYQTSHSWSDRTCNNNLKNHNYVPVSSDIARDIHSAFKHEISEDLALVHDLSIKHEKIDDNDDSLNQYDVTSGMVFDGKQRRYKPVSRLTEAQRQRRRLMDRERQRRRRERIRAANLDFYQMYQY